MRPPLAREEEAAGKTPHAKSQSRRRTAPQSKHGCRGRDRRSRARFLPSLSADGEREACPAVEVEVEVEGRGRGSRVEGRRSKVEVEGRGRRSRSKVEVEVHVHDHVQEQSYLLRFPPQDPTSFGVPPATCFGAAPLAACPDALRPSPPPDLAG
jgi:hypothetical protein